MWTRWHTGILFCGQPWYWMWVDQIGQIFYIFVYFFSRWRWYIMIYSLQLLSKAWGSGVSNTFEKGNSFCVYSFLFCELLLALNFQTIKCNICLVFIYLFLLFDFRSHWSLWYHMCTIKIIAESKTTFGEYGRITIE